MDYEKMGAFYLGKDVDPTTMEMGQAPLLYDSKDLTTHAVCVGMTGSGKTGLCLSLLEEAAMDGIPAIAIDPKGDIGNLLLSFPELRPDDFKPWVDAGEAERKGKSIDEFAKDTADLWKNGLAEWDQSGDRIKKLREKSEFRIYTPGSEAGLGLSILHSFKCPDKATVEDTDALRDKITSTCSGLLSMVGVDADPLQSRDHILLSTILDTQWKEGNDLDVKALIKLISKPGIDTVGAFDLEDFYPAKERMGLAMKLNNLIASPSFSSWTKGEELSAKKLLWSEDGKPRISIISIAHLSDAERMFFVTLLLGEVTAWMRRQSGTSSLRAMLYMDEIFGFLPPTANPPSKHSLLLLLKQARAFGLGLVLATQNPVDIDYKALSNAGTWFLGRLQTEQDVNRVIEGLKGAASQAGKSLDAGEVSKILAGLQKRMFLMNNVHDDGPTLFSTRWAMSFLRGPLTRTHIKTLMDPYRQSQEELAQAAKDKESSSPKATKKEAPVKSGESQQDMPVIEDTVSQWFMVKEDADEPLVYRPYLLGHGELHYVNSKADVDEYKTMACLRSANEISGRAIWGDSDFIDTSVELDTEPKEGASFKKLDKKATKEKSFSSWEKSLKTHFYKEAPLILFECEQMKLVSELGEEKSDFKIRVRETARERRDEALEKLRDKYAPKVVRLEERIASAKHQVEKKTESLSQQKYSTALSAGATVLGALFGRKVASRGNVGRAATTMRGVGRASSKKGDVERAQEKVADLEQKLVDLEEELKDKLEDAKEFDSVDAFEIEEKLIRLRKTDTEITKMGILWIAK